MVVSRALDHGEVGVEATDESELAGTILRGNDQIKRYRAYNVHPNLDIMRECIVRVPCKRAHEVVSTYFGVEPQLVPGAEEGKSKGAMGAIACGWPQTRSQQLSDFIRGARARTVVNLAVVYPIAVPNDEVRRVLGG